MSQPEPEPDRWALTIHFDDLRTQEKTHPDLAFPRDECSRLIAFITEAWGLSPEELQSIAEWGPSRITLHLDELEFAIQVMQWLGSESIPQSVLLRRNESR
jgi:hypothetical protein